MKQRDVRLLFVVVTCVLVALIWKVSHRRKEYYGGPIKNSRKIPMTDCYQRCDEWAARCAVDRPGDEYRCYEMGQHCRAECYFSNSHRQ